MDIKRAHRLAAKMIRAMQRFLQEGRQRTGTVAQPGALPETRSYRNSRNGPKRYLKRRSSPKDRWKVPASRAGSMPRVPPWRWDFEPFPSAPCPGASVWGAPSAAQGLAPRIRTPCPLQSQSLKWRSRYLFIMLKHLPRDTRWSLNRI